MGVGSEEGWDEDIFPSLPLKGRFNLIWYDETKTNNQKRTIDDIEGVDTG